MRDRIPKHPGRVKLRNVSTGEESLFDMTMADEPDVEGTPPTKQFLLQDSTEEELFGSSADRSVNDAFLGVASILKLIAGNFAAINLTVTDTTGNPVSGVYVDGITNQNGQSVATNSEGKISGVIAQGSAKVSISGYADIENFSKTYQIVKGRTYNESIQITTRNFIKITGSQAVKFSGNVSSIDFSLGGPGGPGGAGVRVEYGSLASGGAGAGGECIVKTDVSVSPGQSYQAVIGVSGSPGSWSNGTEPTKSGTSSFMGYTAQGGGAGTNAKATNSSTATPGIGGTGNGAGANGVTCTDGYGDKAKSGLNGSIGTGKMFSSFTDEEDYGGGGGSGTVGSSANNSSGQPKVAGKGAGKGADGGYATASGQGMQNGKSASSNTGGGGGSGAAAYDSNYSTRIIGDGGRGGSGCLAIRMHLKSEQ